MSENQGEPPVAKRRRARKHVSCVPCRTRKIRCDRQVPSCSSCVRRGLQHLCRWGDERDENMVARKEPEMDFLQHLPPKFPLFGPSQLKVLYNRDRKAWAERLQSYLDLLPSRRAMDSLIEYYVREIDPIYGFVNEAILELHLDLLYSHLGLSRASAYPEPTGSGRESMAGSSGTLDRAKAIKSSFWMDARNYGLLALLFAILYAAASMLEISDIQARHIFESQDAEGVTARIDALHDAGIFFFQHSNMIEQPTLWTLQNFNILSIKYLNMREMHIVVIWNRLAISLAQHMGLNRLGSTLDDLTHELPSTMPSNDILECMPWVDEMSPTDLPQRELGRLIWATLLRFDWFSSVHVDYTYSVCESMNQTSAPAALCPEEVLMLRQLPRSVLRDPNRPSPMVFFRILLDLGRIVCQISEILLRQRSVRQKRQLSLEETMHMDQQIRALQASLPRYFHLDQDVSDERTQAILEKHPYLKLQRLFLQEQINYRLMRLHMPFIEEDIHTGHTSLSVETCAEGARISIAVHEELEQTNNPNRRVPYLFWHLLTNATVLQRILIHYPMPLPRQMQLMQSLRYAVHHLEHAPLPTSFSTNPHLQAAIGALRRFCQGVQTDILGNASASTSSTREPTQTYSTHQALPVALGDHGPPMSVGGPPSGGNEGSLQEFEIPGWTNSDDAMLLAGLELLLELPS